MSDMSEFDFEIYSEEEAYDKAYELIENEDLEEAAKSIFDFRSIFDVLPDRMKELIIEDAHMSVMEKYFTKVDDEEED